MCADSNAGVEIVVQELFPASVITNGESMKSVKRNVVLWVRQGEIVEFS